MRSFYLKSLVCMGFLLAMPLQQPLLAQEKSPVPVTLQVVDPTGANIPYAQIEMIPSPRSTSEPLETDAKGQLTVDLKPGGYCISITSNGFVRLEEHFEISGPRTISFKLAIGGGCHTCVLPEPI